ncbi:TfoX/Sxy family protein [uncultured Maribacter sp.]|uniref:TfoX/Sxy family protein n=1 Tax=uncultured Maribacter sp. TaxID=431308 RepID=UPI00261CF729|nr:TfoX/Sxy family protein [uncultured Maribacter sp.]
MSYPEELECRIDWAITIFPKNIKDNFSKKRMFGGLAYLFKGKMTIGVIKNDLMVRILSKDIDIHLKKDFVRPMDFTKRPMKEFVYVAQDGCKTEEQLQNWLELGLEHAQSKLKSL